MRSSKSRSRSKPNRQRSLGNIINRVFDSSGPEGKVRGTPQQIIDKYLMLARDAQLSNDRVAEQNFLQHAEHYTRMLGEAQREMNREQEQRQQAQNENNQNNQNNNGQHANSGGNNNGQHAHNGGNNNNHNNGNQNNGGQNNGGNNGGERQNQRPRYEDRAERHQPEVVRDAAPRVEEADDGPGLVETPENNRSAAPMAPMMPEMPQPDLASPVAEPKKRAPRGPRKPREPKAKAEAVIEDSPKDSTAG